MPKREASWPLGKGAGVCVHDKALDPKLCSNVIEFFAERPHLCFPGQTFGGVLPDVKLSTDSYVDSNNPNANDDERLRLSELEHEVYESYKVVLADYISAYEHLVSGWTNRIDSGYQYQRYDKGAGFYKPHIDGAPYLDRAGNERVLASVMYLNTVKKGGGTRFEYFDYTCDAIEGRILTFPATFLHLHAGVVPKSSFKSIISTFVACPAIDTHS